MQEVGFEKYHPAQSQSDFSEKTTGGGGGGVSYSVYTDPVTRDHFGYSQSGWSPEGQRFHRQKGISREILKQRLERGDRRKLRGCQNPASSLGNSCNPELTRQEEGALKV